MAVKKISELDTKSFLGGAGAAANSYVLINYEDNSTNAPVTYKATILELGKAIANNLHLYKETAGGAAVINVSQGTYIDGETQLFMSDSIAVTDVTGAASIGYVTNAISGLASTGAVTAAVNDLASTGYVTNAISGLASTGYVTAAINNGGGGGFNPTTSVPCLGMYAPEGSDAETENLYPAMAYGQMICTPNSDANYFSPLHLLYYEKDGTDLKLKDEFNNTLYTLTGVISNS